MTRYTREHPKYVADLFETLSYASQNGFKYARFQDLVELYNALIKVDTTHKQAAAPKSADEAKEFWSNMMASAKFTKNNKLFSSGVKYINDPLEIFTKEHQKVVKVGAPPSQQPTDDSESKGSNNGPVGTCQLLKIPENS